MSSSSAPILGIDLGTTMSAAAVFQGDEVRFIPNPLDETLTPSVVALDARSGGLVVGRTAKEIMAVTPSLAAATFKRAMGTDTEVTMGDKRFSPVELSAYVLDALRSDAERVLGTTVDRCVVTVPAYFGEAQRHATKQAAEMVGFKVERVLSEPTAAAIAHGLHEGDDEKQFVVVDLGGGTFDVCVMELFEGLLEVKGVAGVSQLGGEDFTLALRDLVLARAEVDPGTLDHRTMTVLLKRAELLKRRLTRWSSSEIDVPTGEGSTGASAPSMGGLPQASEAVGSGSAQGTLTVSQADAEDAYRPLLDRMVAPCRSALRGAGVRPKDLDEVILVGGATRMPCVAALARELFGLEPRILADPDHVVVRGAAIQAALCAKMASVSEMVVTDVASHSLGINVAREIGGRLQDGYFTPVVERNTVIPTSRAEVFSTVGPNQRSITVEVFEGESRKTADNRKLGEFEVKGIPKGKARDAVQVRFTYDLNGILEVEATVLETGKAASRIFQRGGGELSGAALDKAKDEIRRLKADPRERPRHRDLLARATALWSELSGLAREQLASLIDDFEQALEARNPTEIDRSFEALQQACTHLDDGERW